MSREVRMVPMNFAWPIGKIWKGFLNPFYEQSKECPFCDGSGYSPEAKNLKDKWYGYVPFCPEERGSVPFTTDNKIIIALAKRNSLYQIEREAVRLCEHFNGSWMHHLNNDDVIALIKGNRLYDFTHTWTKESGWQPKSPPYIPTAIEVNEWSLKGFGHDAINQWIATKAECKRLGYKTGCNFCAGSGELWPSKKVKKQYESWKKFDPPAGKGWQMWETVSEGSPMSPVFSTAEELAHWLADNGASSFGHMTATYEQWLATIKSGSAVSAVMENGVMKSGVEAGAELDKSK
jgi:hypothetical protein